MILEHLRKACCAQWKQHHNIVIFSQREKYLYSTEGNVFQSTTSRDKCTLTKAYRDFLRKLPTKSEQTEEENGF